VAIEHNGMKNVSRRSAFLIGADGIVQGAWEYETSEVPDFDVLLEAAQRL
jgi:peroxiredoxin